MHRSSFRILSFYLVFVSLPCWGALERQILWQKQSPEGFAGVNELRDGQTGQTLGILACDVGQGLVCFDLAGKEMWRVPMTPPVTACPAVYDFGGDGHEEMVACDGDRKIFLIDDSGKILWTAQTRGRVQAESCPAVGDLDGDGAAEVVVGDLSGAVSCFDSEGRLRWSFVAGEGQMGPVLLADLYTTPGLEVFVTSHNGHIYALSTQGEYLWDLHHPHEVMPGSLPVVADVEGDGIPEIYIGGGLNHFLRIDPRGPNVVLDENVDLHINTALCAGDIDLDGKDEVLFGNKGGKVFCYGAEGFFWTREFHTTSMSSPPLLLDLDEDPQLELVFSFHGTQVLDTDGTVLAEMQNPICNAAPLAGDFDRDGFLEVVLAGNGMMASTGLTLYRWNVPYRESPHEWTVFAGNRAHSGRPAPTTERKPLDAPHGVFYSTPVPAGTLEEVDAQIFTGKNTWRFDVGHAGYPRLTLLNEIVYPSGKVARFASHVESENQRVSFSFVADEPGTYKVHRILMEPDVKALLLESGGFHDSVGSDSDLEFIQETLFQTERKVESWKATNPKAAAAFDSERLSLSGQSEALHSSPHPKEPAALSAALGSLRSQSLRLMNLAASGKTLAATGSFASWQTQPWSYFDPVETLPPPEAVPPKIERTLCANEYDSVALNLTSFSGRSLEVRVFADDLKSGTQTVPAPRHLAIRRAVVVPTLRGEEVADALPKLDQGSLLPISPLETSQLWLTLNANGLAPGIYTSTLHLKSLETSETHLKVPIEITVADLTLPRPRPLRFAVWAYAWNWPDYLLQDLVDHGVTVHFGIAPKGTCDAEGALGGDLDFADHDASVKRLAPYGTLLFVGSQGSLGGQPFLSEAWKKGYVAYLRAWVAHLTDLGLGYEDFALYPYDEPSTPYSKITLNLVEVAKVIREADPNIRIYTDPTSGTNRESLEMLEGLIDIWCPSAELLERFGDEILPFAREHGKETWFYDAAGHAKTLSPLGIYRWRFWYAWNLGLTGVGWWTYKYDIDQWEARTEGGDHFYHIYDAPGTVVTSKRWEAAREGIEDYELLCLLRESLADAETRSASPESLATSQELLETLPPQMEQRLHSAGRRIPLTPDSVPLYDRVSAGLDETHNQIIQECLKLRSE